MFWFVINVAEVVTVTSTEGFYYYTFCQFNMMLVCSCGADI